MSLIKLISWNVNGLRAAHKKNLMDFIKKENPDVLCFQEIKAQKEQLPLELQEMEGYHSYFNSAERKGYSGVAVYTKIKPEKVETTFGKNHKDVEGRILALYFKEYVLFNIYFPNGGGGEERLKYKLEFYDIFLKHIEKLKKTTNVIFCGDVNTAHTEKDLARPKENETRTGFLPVERQWMDNLVSKGYTDTFRMFNKDGGNYTWWDMKTRARERDVGWRIDYFFVNNDFKDAVVSSEILKDIQGSDHCPILIKLESN